MLLDDGEPRGIVSRLWIAPCHNSPLTLLAAAPQYWDRYLAARSVRIVSMHARTKVT